nr:MAG TPA: hypothetical protein [Caudoviricetes sp.]
MFISLWRGSGHAFFISFYDNRFIVVYHLSDNFSPSL